MTFYPGGKKRFSRFIVDAIMNDLDTISPQSTFNTYIEPFCGMASVFEQLCQSPIDRLVKSYHLSDRNPFLIRLLKGFKNGYDPVRKCSKAKYLQAIRDNATDLDSLYIGFACAYRGDFRSTYFPHNNMTTQRHRSLLLGKLLHRHHVKLSVNEYSDYETRRGCLIYCDPPFENTQSPYRVADRYERQFDTAKFLKWCQKVARHNTVYVSEYRDFSERKHGMKLIWSRGQQRLYRVVCNKK